MNPRYDTGKGGLWQRPFPGVRTCDSVTAVFVPIDENVAQVIVQAKLEQGIAGAGNRPAVLVVMIHNESMSLGAVPEFLVVICTASGAVLDAQNVIVVVYHFVEQGGGDFLDGAGQGTGSDVDLVGSALLADPGVIPEREVAVGLGRGLDGDSGS